MSVSEDPTSGAAAVPGDDPTQAAGAGPDEDPTLFHDNIAFLLREPAAAR